ncbi:hypothetical protein SPAR143_0347 [Streptococcus pneumoniae NP070]|nr:hypothetical protein SPND219_00386 [Streptococcus pneumoniae]EGI88097.1 hypothetical protein SPAR68_0378 [Streptococcus pneumoniae GA41301]EHD58254.1 hypothetical protein SPAR143_0347 [Streptococcus pneumoniae NP070]EHD78463.1 hypothetical protein SPAR82_0325 [Streptococcus pneumoniae GA44378]EHD81355.1 hypothetical protein SPAR144_0319 [Streptococcus pneumoniae NP170]EHE06794.1 hypothetical protein SPAR43_0317 [Streptococcus pneumoniae GA17227]EHZ07106.1 hypothetical protein SPAR7_0335 [S
MDLECFLLILVVYGFEKIREDASFLSGYLCNVYRNNDY